MLFQLSTKWFLVNMTPCKKAMGVNGRRDLTQILNVKFAAVDGTMNAFCWLLMNVFLYLVRWQNCVIYNWISCTQVSQFSIVWNLFQLHITCWQSHLRTQNGCHLQCLHHSSSLTWHILLKPYFMCKLKCRERRFV